ncbi:Gamma-glutamyl phosphate reductase family protein [Selenomonas sp. oral taxon 137 str. F0430]|nr:Gamma-glutamyl phosphate reductase family protein [Selenomonas sp. oral taxon 137 str. F0430]
MTIEQEIHTQAEAAKAASYPLAALPPGIRNDALCAMAQALTDYRAVILQANAADMEEAAAAGMKSSYLDRLHLDDVRIEGMAEGLRLTAGLPDPLGREDFSVRRPNGLEIRRLRVPLGVIGIIYEARPNVTSDAVGLCIKSGNAVLLRGGSDALRSNRAVVDVLARAAYAAGVPHGAVQLLAMKDRAAVDVMTHLTGLLDVIIPRGGAGLIRRIVESSTVPVIETGAASVTFMWIVRRILRLRCVLSAMQRYPARPSATRRRPCSCMRMRHRHFCRVLPKSSVQTAWSCADARARLRFCPMPSPLSKRTGGRNTANSSSPYALFRIFPRQSRTSTVIIRGIRSRL